LTADSVTSASAQSITANGLTSGNLLSLSSSSTSAANGNKGLDIAISGANSTASITRTGLSSVVTSTGTTSTNVGGYFSASGATNNYGLIVGNGNVGIGTTTPTSKLTVAGTTPDTPIVTGGSNSVTLYGSGNTYFQGRDATNDIEFIMGTSTAGEAFAGSMTPHDFTLRTNNTTRLKITGTGNVGIGTTTPLTKFDVAGVSRSGGVGPTSATTLSSAATISDTTLTVVSTTDYPSSGLLYLTDNNNSEVVSYTGITGTTFTGVTRGRYNTTARAWSSGNTADLVVDLVAGRNETSNPRMILTQTKGFGFGMVPSGWVNSGATQYSGTLYTGSGLQASNTNSGLFFGTSSAWVKGTGGSSSATDYVALGTNSTERMRVDGNGNIGVGTTTPMSLLEISPSTPPLNAYTITATNGATTFSTSGSISLNSGDYIVPSTAAQARTVTVSATGTSFTVSPAFTANITGENFRVYSPVLNAKSGSIFIQGSTGNVGIKNTNPQRDFEVSGATSFGSSYITNNLSVGTGNNSYKVDVNTSGARALNITNSSTTATSYGAYITKSGAATNGIGLYVTSAGATNNYAAIFDQGYVGIVVTAPTTKLHVLGSSGATIATFADGGATTCTVTPASTGFACSSDERLKKNIESYSDEESLENILQLRTVTYNWRSVDNGRHTGYIAQELEKIAPEFVRTGEDGFKQVNYTGLVPWITGAIKAFYAEFKNSIDAVNSRTDLLESENAALKLTASKLESDNAKLKDRIDQQERELAAIKNKLGL